MNARKSINQISIELNRSHSTILREIDRNKVYYKPSNWNNCYNDKTKDYSCNKLSKPPHVCNGCKSRSGCRKERFTYYVRKANDSYKELINSCRQGISLSEDEMFNINNVIYHLVKKGQTTNHLYINHPGVLNFSIVSFYNYINAGVFEFGPLDFPRIVKHKKRKNKKRRTRKEREIRVGRTYDDLNIVEMDTVEGLKSDSKCILTLFWRKSNFMLMFLLERQITEEVTKIKKIFITENYKYQTDK